MKINMAKNKNGMREYIDAITLQLYFKILKLQMYIYIVFTHLSVNSNFSNDELMDFL